MIAHCMSREILPLQRESGVATSATRSKTMLVRFNHVTGLAVNSFAPYHLNIPITVTLPKPNFVVEHPVPGASQPGQWGAGSRELAARSVSPRPSLWQK